MVPVNSNTGSYREGPALRVADLPEVPDLCVIATPAQAVPGLIEEIGQFGGRAVVVITAGVGSCVSACLRPHAAKVHGSSGPIRSARWRHWSGSMRERWGCRCHLTLSNPRGMVCHVMG
ncbi:CoA-binding protein [Devosia sp.]|uniref:CoA-binding protein n=1 Tax=Devosia sp. TaxID=1871048 RepID=UPI003FA54E44